MKITTKIKITTKCPSCKSTHDLDLDLDLVLDLVDLVLDLDLDPAAVRRWQRGTLIQNAFPDMSADDRERLITGICPSCRKKLFKDT